MSTLVCYNGDVQMMKTIIFIVFQDLEIPRNMMMIAAAINVA